MKSIEFYQTPKGGIMIHDEKGARLLRETDRNFIGSMIEKLSEFYPEALSELSKQFEKSMLNIPHFEFRIVTRFIKCNWAKFDSMMDIDQFGNLNFEEVECPLRGECPLECIVCKPKFNSKLSDRELDIMGNFYEGMTAEEISFKLCLSVETVKTHKRNAFRRTESHSMSEFFLYAKTNNLFK